MNMHASLNPADICAVVSTETAPWSSGHVPLEPYRPTDEITDAVRSIVTLHRLRQDMIRAATKLSLQGQAAIRFMFQTDEDFTSDEAKEKARKRTESLYKTIAADPSHQLFHYVQPYLLAATPLEQQRDTYEKALRKEIKRLPVYDWVKGVKGFGDMSFATIVGECGDIGSYKSVSAVWKRMGLAVINGKRQGNPGAGATAEDWIEHGYNKQRRSVSFVARQHVIGGMGLWRPSYGEDVDANPDLTHYQRVFAKRARYEAAGFCHFKKKNGEPILDESGEIARVVKNEKTGRESYSAHAAMRAHRYVEKMLLKHLYIEWRRA